MLANVGIDWQYQSLDSSAIADGMKNLEYDLAQGGSNYIFDPDMSITSRYHPGGGSNYGRSHNEKAIALIKAGKEEIDPIKRQKIYFKFEKALYDNYEDVWLWWPMLVGILRKNVQGYGSERLRDQGGSAFWHSHPLWLEDGKPYYFQLWHRLPKKRNKYSCLLKFSIVAVYNRLISWGPHGKR